jgi:uncharacterized protein with ATP-grasp and redox domains
MRSFFECVPCFFQQALRAAGEAGLDEAQTLRLVVELGQWLEGFDPEVPPPVNGRFLYRRVAELSGRPDPYAEAKRRHTELALGLLPRLRQWVEQAEDALDAAARIAAAGNILDLGAMSSIEDLDGVLDRALHLNHEPWHISALAERLQDAEEILLLGDNAGEAVFDRVLLETLRRIRPEARLVFAVRGGPIINDATEEDAKAAGVDCVATLLTTGSDTPGVVLEEVAPELRAVFDRADLVISKGQGNLETLHPAPREVFFILTVKCRVVSRHLGVPLGASVLLCSGPGNLSRP